MTLIINTRIVYSQIMLRYSIDELSATVGLPSSTIRMYQQRGLIEPPVRSGRKAVYGQAHVEALALVARLKARGYSLAAISDMQTVYDEGSGLESIFGSEGERNVEIDMAALLGTLFPDGHVDPAVIQRALDLGLIAIGDVGVTLSDPRDLAVGVELIGLGVPTDDILDEYEALTKATDAIAVRFADVFERYVLPDSKAPADDLVNLNRLAKEIVQLALARSMEKELKMRLDLAGVDED